MDSRDPDPSPNKPSVPESSSPDVSAAVEDLLNTMSNKFASVSSEIFAKKDECLVQCVLIIRVVDDMSRRLENLEAALQAGKDKEISKS
ncbi:hypothetical protein E4U23_003900 [Claviceps purpurea]|nr:hypothetical protein E4U51_003570 [Claviceps purpurea]KAG6176855.1 hypothetical protein E4U27_004796 [Claviceps purpurea]KAG6257535.1 hypothetical protein E4U23_003900 [Claviceps purpurea]KAG6265939.1 hypothetical protein E4U49_000661 [Claviceps purpurea]KAG6307195.1 hypothetical protein E4U45_005358 [Claviceps purpurea]